MEIKTKYNIGDKVYFLKEDKIVSMFVKSPNWLSNRNEKDSIDFSWELGYEWQIKGLPQPKDFIGFESNIRRESQLFKTKEDLIKSL